jgi:DNA-binding NtrC family response regulator
MPWRWLQEHDWPGNIRELENAIHRAIVLSDGGLLTRDLFPQIEAQMPGYKLASSARGLDLRRPIKARMKQHLAGGPPNIGDSP